MLANLSVSLTARTYGPAAVDRLVESRTFWFGRAAVFVAWHRVGGPHATGPCRPGDSPFAAVPEYTGSAVRVMWRLPGAICNHATRGMPRSL